MKILIVVHDRAVQVQHSAARSYFLPYPPGNKHFVLVVLYPRSRETSRCALECRVPHAAESPSSSLLSTTSLSTGDSLRYRFHAFAAVKRRPAATATIMNHGTTNKSNRHALCGC